MIVTTTPTSARGCATSSGGRSAGYEDELEQARTKAMREMEERASRMGAHAIVGVDFDYEVLGAGDMLMVTASGTAVTVEAL